MKCPILDPDWGQRANFRPYQRSKTKLEVTFSPYYLVSIQIPTVHVVFLTHIHTITYTILADLDELRIRGPVLDT